MSNPYTNYPLDTSKRDVRVLQLLPGSWSDTVECNLVKQSLDHHPNYEALSYAWGDHNQTRPITVDGCTLHVTANLQAGLRRLRYADRPRLLWVDAICIDQDDVDEKNWQVTLMGDIFRRSKQALIWLGEVAAADPQPSSLPGDGLVEQPASPGTARAASWRGDDASDQSLLEEWRSEFVAADDDDDEEEEESRVSCPLTFDTAFHMFSHIRMLAGNKHFHQLPSFSNSKYVPYEAYWIKVTNAMKVFISNTWFDRIWCVQEYVLSPSATIVYGSIECPVEMLVEAASNVLRHGSSRCCVDSRDSSLAFNAFKDLSNRIFQFSNPRMIFVGEYRTDLWTLCCHLRNWQATEDVDKIYGVLGMVKDWKRSQQLVPDYRMSANELYTQVSARTLYDYDGLMPFYVNLDKARHPELPSWVVDWTLSEDTADYNHQAQMREYQATGSDRAAMTDVIPNTSILKVKGFTLDTISAIGSIVRFGQDARADVATFAEWFSLCRLHRDSDRLYPTGCTWRDAFWRTMCGDTLSTYASGRRTGWRRARPEDDEAFAHFCILSYRSPFQKGGVPETEQACFKNHPAFESHVTLTSTYDSMYDAIRASTIQRRLIFTRGGLVGLGRAATRVGDSVALLAGGYTPFIIRAANDIAAAKEGIPTDAVYKLIGDCFVHGLMDGEGMAQHKDRDDWTYLV